MPEKFIVIIRDNRTLIIQFYRKDKRFGEFSADIN